VGGGDVIFRRRSVWLGVAFLAVAVVRLLFGNGVLG
jgi:hypothetical protein